MKYSFVQLLCFCGLLLAVSGAMSTSVGSSTVVIGDLFHWGSDSAVVFWQIRFPRIVLAVLCGGALAVAGVLTQGLFRNSLAAPSILGTTAGAGLAAIIVFYSQVGLWSWWGLPLAAITGAALSTLLVLAIVRALHQISIGYLLLIGFALNTLLSAISTLILSLMLEQHERASAAMHWLLGGFVARGWNEIALACVPIGFGIIWTTRFWRQIDIVSLGEDASESLGVDIQRLKIQVVLVTALLVGGVVSVAGAIPFVGLIVPHLTRLFTGPRTGSLLVISFLNGAVLTLVADMFARTIRHPLELDVGVVLSLIGAPFFIWIVMKNNSRHKGML